VTSVFTRIAKREIPGYFVAENDDFFAILDINPLAKGHTLVISKVEIDYVFDLESIYLGQFFLFAQSVAKAMDKVIDCERIGLAVVGLEVPHAHIHLVPINSVRDIDFSAPKLTFSDVEMRQVQSDIKSRLII
tara:strand:- start:807 stop:1205 length:399 start_codon:yes stop_codon:yes gene_type:complete